LSPVSATPQTQAFFIEDLGALFVAQVDFPLAVHKTDEAGEAKEPERSVWEETRQELYGAAVPRSVPLTTRYGQWAASREAAKPYDAKKVTELQDTLLKTLELAANIRCLEDPEDTVAVAVLGLAPKAVAGSQPRWRLTVEGGESRLVQIPFSGPVAARPTVLTIRLKKSDVDAFATGDIPFDQWRNKATILTY
jgi:hypothetical protein